MIHEPDFRALFEPAPVLYWLELLDLQGALVRSFGVVSARITHCKGPSD